MRTAQPLPFFVPLNTDGEFVITLRESSTHRRIIVRDDGDDSILWDSNWATVAAVLDADGMYSVTFSIPKQRITAARTAKLAGRAIVIELWLRHPLVPTGSIDVLEFGLDLKL